MIDLRRSEARRDRRDLAERHDRTAADAAARRARRPAPQAASRRPAVGRGRRRSRATPARAARARSARSPADRPTCPRRRRRRRSAATCASWLRFTPNVPARPRLTRTLSSGFCPRVERPTSTAPGVSRTIVSICSASCCERRRIGTLQLELQLLLRAAKARRVRERGRAAEQAQVGCARSGRAASWLIDAIVLRLETHVDARVVDLARAGAAADRRVRVQHFGSRANHPRDFFRLERRVVEARPRRRLDRDVQLALIAHRDEREAADHDLQRDRARRTTRRRGRPSSSDDRAPRR